MDMETKFKTLEINVDAPPCKTQSGLRPVHARITVKRNKGGKSFTVDWSPFSIDAICPELSYALNIFCVYFETRDKDLYKLWEENKKSFSRRATLCLGGSSGCMQCVPAHVALKAAEIMHRRYRIALLHLASEDEIRQRIIARHEAGI